MKFLKSKLMKARGFTLLELVIVIAIIGILAVIVLPNMIQALGKARDARKMSELRGIQTFLTTIGIDTNLRYPSVATTSGAETGIQNAFTATKSRIPTGLSDGTYKYVGINCNATDYPSEKIPGGSTTTNNVTCGGYQLWVELEQSTPALASDADVTTAICNNYGATTCPVAVTVYTATTEACTSLTATDCVFDLAP